MRVLASMTVKELRRTLRDPLALALWLFIPLSILTLMNLAFGGGGSSGPRPQGVLLIADQDETIVSGVLASAFGQGPLGNLFKPEKTAEADGRARMNRGEATALLIVPKGFQERVLRNEKIALPLVTNPSQRILPAIAAEALKMLSEGVHYLHLVAGGEIESVVSRQGTPTEAQVLETSRALYRSASSLARYLDPLVLGVDFQAAPQKEAAPFNLLLLLFPGMVFMSLLFLARGMSDDLWEELRCSTWRRSLAAGAGVSSLVAAKLISVVAVAAPVAVMAVAAGRWVADIPVANWPAAVAWICAGAAVWYLIMFELQVLAGAEHRGDILTSVVLFPSIMTGGSMFGFAMMPGSLARIGKATPLGWMVFRFDLILQGKATAQQVGLWMALMAAAAAVLFLFSGWHLRRRFLRG